MIKDVILGSGGSLRVYSVPDKIADQLEGSCWYFRSIWIFDEPQSQRFVKNGCARYNEADFSDYLNQWETPEYPSILVEELGVIEDNEIPEQYQNCPRYHF